MSKVKQWAWDEAEKAVDKIILQVKQNLITKETAAKDIMKVDNVELCGIYDYNVDEVIDMELEAA
jgi:hypothetical protein|tara:strand:+ start:459 stop:653 length:195 start_codon:yes stop_codon:yes gene_type:complete